jgi:hypothetical protein
MEILSQFSAGNLGIKLTAEKLFIETAISTETFALRSVNGIGVIDLVDDYNKKLRDKNEAYTRAVLFLILGIFSICCTSTTTTIIGLLFGAIAYMFYAKTKVEPVLMSAVRIMMSGGNRDFQFDKNGVKSGNVAEFVALVESTLTSYHKENN